MTCVGWADGGNHRHRIQSQKLRVLIDHWYIVDLASGTMLVIITLQRLVQLLHFLFDVVRFRSDVQAFIIAAVTVEDLALG